MSIANPISFNCLENSLLIRSSLDKNISTISDSYNNNSNINEFETNNINQFTLKRNEDLSKYEKDYAKKKSSNKSQNLFNKKATVSKRQYQERERDLKQFMIFTEGLSPPGPNQNILSKGGNKQIVKVQTSEPNAKKVIKTTEEIKTMATNQASYYLTNRYLCS